MQSRTGPWASLLSRKGAAGAAEADDSSLAALPASSGQGAVLPLSPGH